MSYRYVDGCDCGQGLLLVVKNKETKKLLLLCSDCNCIWSDPDSFYSAQRPISDGFDMNTEDDVSKEEIIEAGWDKYVKNMDDPIDI